MASAVFVALLPLASLIVMLAPAMARPVAATPETVVLVGAGVAFVPPPPPPQATSAALANAAEAIAMDVLLTRMKCPFVLVELTAYS